MTRTSGSGTRRRRAAGAARAWPGEPVLAQRRHQVTDIEPAPAPKVTEYVAQAKQCPCCGTVTRGRAAGARAGAGQLRAGGARAGREPDLRPLHPRLAGRRCCCASWPGVAVSAGWMAGIRGEGRRAGRGQRVHGPGPGAAAARGGGARGRDPGPRCRRDCGTCTWPAPRYLTHMHTGDRSADAIDAGGVLPGYAGHHRPRRLRAGTGTSPARCTPGAAPTCSGT